MGFIIRAEMKRAEKHFLELLQLVTSEGSKIELISINILQFFISCRLNLYKIVFLLRGRQFNWLECVHIDITRIIVCLPCLKSKENIVRSMQLRDNMFLT